MSNVVSMLHIVLALVAFLGTVVSADDVLVSLKPKDEEGVHHHLPKPRDALGDLPALYRDLAIRTVKGRKSSTHNNYMKAIKMNAPRMSEMLSLEHIQEIKKKKDRETKKRDEQEEEKQKRKNKFRQGEWKTGNRTAKTHAGASTNTDTRDPDDKHDRHRRMVGQSDNAWPLAIIPYYFELDYPSDVRREISYLIQFFTDFSPVRFVPYEGSQTNDQYGLGHYARVKFIIDNGCYANRGYKPSHPDMEFIISCVYCGYMCLHELGHVLSFWHEQQNPESVDYERINLDEIDINQINIPKNFDLQYQEQTFGYLDMDSIMHYSDRAFAKNGRTVVYKFDEDYLAADIYSMDISSHFYMSQETNYLYGPIASPDRSCVGSTVVCEHHGFLEYQVLQGGCRCRCVHGLDPDTNCGTIKHVGPAPTTWPAGDYGLLAPGTGCPGTAGDFFTGQAHANSNYEYLSADWDAAGMTPLWPGALDLEFCMRDPAMPSAAPWDPGMYCIFKGSSCPPEFNEGALYFNDIDNATSHSGYVPSGDYSSDHVRLDTCCREDAYFTIPIRLPTDRPFFLLPRYLECQEVEGMKATMEYVWYNNIVTGYEATGSHSFVKYSGTYVRVEVCFYTPIAYDDCGGIFILDDVTSTLSVQTPNFPTGNYPLNVQCVWYIEGQSEAVRRGGAAWCVEYHAAAVIGIVESNAALSAPGR